jgi:5-methylthioadenosine/S-adenosylhomocysteine deaminase
MTGRILIKGGTIITMDPEIADLRQGDLLIESGRIVAVGPSIEADDCKRIDAEGMVVIPGLVDAHRHLWYTGVRAWGMDSVFADMVSGLWPKLARHYSPEDLYVCNKVGILEALDNGITTVFDWCHLINTPEHARSALKAHLALPHRAVFALGGSMQRKLAEFDGVVENDDSWDLAREFRQGPLADHDRITLALAIQGPETSSLEITRADIAAARSLDVPISMHIDVLAGRPSKRGVAALHAGGELASDMQFVHCCATDDDEFAMIAEAGGRVAVSPMCEIALGFGEPPIARMLNAGLRPGFGVDAVCAASGDQFDEARTGLLSQRMIATRQRNLSGEVVDEFSQLDYSTRQALAAITSDAAHACWLENEIGSLTPGKAADVVLLRSHALNLSPLSDVVKTLVGNAHGADVDTVLVAGKVVKRGGELLDVDRAAVTAELEAMRDRVFALECAEDIQPPLS